MIAARYVSSLASVLALGLGACGGGNKAAPPSAPPGQEAPAEPPQGPGPGAQAPAGQLGDEEIAGATAVADNMLISQAEIALARAKNPDVKKFAQKLIDQHLDHKRRQAEIVQKLQIVPAESPTSHTLASEAEKTASALQAREGADFDRAFIDAQIRGHLLLLDILDNRLLPSVRS